MKSIIELRNLITAIAKGDEKAEEELIIYIDDLHTDLRDFYLTESVIVNHIDIRNKHKKIAL